MVKLLAACAALLALLGFAPASADAAMADPAFTVRLLSANGSGCPPGSTTVVPSSTSMFTMIYGSYIATAGGGAPALGFRKNCQLNVSVSVPAGWTYGLLEVNYRGFANLDTGAQGALSASYYFAGLPQTYHVDHSLAGPRRGNYELTNRAAVVEWAPCHFTGTLNINTAITLTAGSGTSFLNLLTIDSPDPPFRLDFRRC